MLESSCWLGFQRIETLAGHGVGGGVKKGGGSLGSGARPECSVSGSLVFRNSPGPGGQLTW